MNEVEDLVARVQSLEATVLRLANALGVTHKPPSKTSITQVVGQMGLEGDDAQ